MPAWFANDGRGYYIADLGIWATDQPPAPLDIERMPAVTQCAEVDWYFCPADTDLAQLVADSQDPPYLAYYETWWNSDTSVRVGQGYNDTPAIEGTRLFVVAWGNDYDWPASAPSFSPESVAPVVPKPPTLGQWCYTLVQSEWIADLGPYTGPWPLMAPPYANAELMLCTPNPAAPDDPWRVADGSYDTYEVHALQGALTAPPGQRTTTTTQDGYYWRSPGGGSIYSDPSAAPTGLDPSWHLYLFYYHPGHTGAPPPYSAAMMTPRGYAAIARSDGHTSPGGWSGTQAPYQRTHTPDWHIGGDSNSASATTQIPNNSAPAYSGYAGYPPAPVDLASYAPPLQAAVADGLPANIGTAGVILHNWEVVTNKTLVFGAADDYIEEYSAVIGIKIPLYVGVGVEYDYVQHPDQPTFPAGVQQGQCPVGLSTGLWLVNINFLGDPTERIEGDLPLLWSAGASSNVSAPSWGDPSPYYSDASLDMTIDVWALMDDDIFFEPTGPAFNNGPRLYLPGLAGARIVDTLTITQTAQFLASSAPATYSASKSTVALPSCRKCVLQFIPRPADLRITDAPELTPTPGPNSISGVIWSDGGDIHGDLDYETVVASVVVDYPAWQYWLPNVVHLPSTVPPYLRMSQRDDGAGIARHPRIINPGVPNGATSTQAASAPRLGNANTYS